jgi:LacI family transcriptional regulator
VDAVFAANILTALGVLRAVNELGLRIPQDLMLATFDHVSMMDAFHPRLTAVAQPTYQIGYQGASMLIQRLKKGGGTPSAPRRTILTTELRIGESTGAN